MHFYRNSIETAFSVQKQSIKNCQWNEKAMLAKIEKAYNEKYQQKKPFTQ